MVVAFVCVGGWFGAASSGVVVVVVSEFVVDGWMAFTRGVYQTPPFVFILGYKLEVVEG